MPSNFKASSASIASNSYQLRSYQLNAVTAAVAGVAEGARGLIVMPTGAGKGIVIAEIVNQLAGKQILIITPRTSLLMQTRALLGAHGVLSSSLGNDLGNEHSVVAGTYQTMTRRPDLEEPDVIIIDECHLVPPDGNYAELVRRFPRAAVIGLTATPFRGGRHIKHCGIEWQQLYAVSMIDLIDQGWLVRPVSMSTDPRLKLTDESSESLAEITTRIVANLRPALEKQARQRCVVFCIDIAHAKLTAKLLRRAGESSVHLVHSHQQTARQGNEIAAFQSAEGRAWLVNVNLVSIGVDIPSVDAIAILRNISSLALLIQVIGRGLRIWPGKRECLVWDFGDGTRRFGFIDDPKLHQTQAGLASVVSRTCPDCGAMVYPFSKSCRLCGHTFPRTIALHELASGAPLLSENYLAATYESASLNEERPGIWTVKHRLESQGTRLFSTTAARTRKEALRSVRKGGEFVIVKRLMNQEVLMVSTR